MNADTKRPFLDFLRDGIARGGFETEDVLAAVLPLMEEVKAAHENGLVAPLEGTNAIFASETHLFFEDATLAPPHKNSHRVQQIEQPASKAVEIVGEARRTTDVTEFAASRVEDLLVAKEGQEIKKPMFLPGYRCWEHALDHHDELTDIFSLGLILGSLACGLDLTETDDLHAFAGRRDNLFALNPRLNPVLASLITQMTELERHRRIQDLGTIIRRLSHYREQSAELEFDLSRIKGFKEANLSGKRKLIQAHLRDRLFEISRRNRLIYFKPTLGTLNLTLASVPLLLDYRNVRPEQLFIWQDSLAKHLSNGDTLVLGNYLRFEDAPYIPGVLDNIIGEARRDRAEFGFAQLRLALVFLRWNNLKEEANERIHSPLLLLPVELVKKKGVRDVYTLKPTSSEAEVNPALRYHLKQLYGLNLPERIDLQETTLDAFFDVLQKQIQASEPGVTLVKLEKPQIQLIHERARQRLDQYRRRMRLAGRGVMSFDNIDYSYQRENFQPLGLQLFLRKVKPSPAPVSDVLRENVTPRTPHIVESGDGEDDAGKVAEVEKQMYAIREADDSNPYRWHFDLCSLTLGNFNYRKMSLVRDYTTLLETDASSAAFDMIFSLEPRDAEEAEKPTLDIEDQWLAVPCDPTQTSAIARARQGKSYIIQGPPGTGKSQTITNLIADYVASGKRVLFVCEKRAAIDVVFFRLRQQGLDELCCLIHDSQTDKKEFILNLKQTYETFLKDGAGNGRAETRRAELVRLIQQELTALQRYSDSMQKVFETTGVPLREMLHRLIELRPHEPELGPLETEQVPEYKQWLACGEFVQRLAAALRDVGEEPLFARLPLRLLNKEIVQNDNPMATILAQMEKAEGIIGQVEAAVAKGRVCSTGFSRNESPDGRTSTQIPTKVGTTNELVRIEDVTALVSFAVKIEPLATWDLLPLLDPECERSRAFAKSVRTLSKCVKAVEQAREKTQNWREKLPANEASAALSQAESLERSIFRFLNPGFWRLRKVLRQRYDFSKHAIKPTLTQILKDLDAEHKAVAAYEEAFREFQEDFGVDDAERCLQLVNEVQGNLASLPASARALQQHLVANPRETKLVHELAALAEPVRQLEAALAAFLADYQEQPLAELRGNLKSIRENLSLLPDLAPVLREMLQVPDKVWRALRNLPLTPEQFEAAMAKRTLHDIYRNDRFLQTFEGRALVRRLERLEKSYRDWMKANADCIRERVRRKFAEHVQISSAPAAQLTEEQKPFKREYAKGRREWEHEFGKTMRYRSIRDMADDETGVVLRDLKPIWLMSPLSVSDTIPLNPREFDVVIFDEASQIPLEEAVPAVYRSNQVIVVGDEMQLPPTNFFSASRSDEDSLLVEEDGEKVEVDLDADSFLSMSARNLPSTLLGWHYRSRYESLISFSNSSFYQGQLLTVPDRQLPPPNLPEIRINAPEQGAANVDELLRRSVSFHFIENGVYGKRRNANEAEYIAHVVRELLRRETKKSIGIVAFSEAQQTEIEAALNQLARADDDFRYNLEAEYEREEDDQFCGLFVKNLENVQGDERDIIILSICYGYDHNKRMLMNFGPINQRGGEKRLNVIFSRARHHMAVVSSIRHYDITNEYNDGANCLRNFLEYAAAVSVGDAATGRRLLAGLTPLREHRPVHREVDAVVRELAEALRGRGYAVDTQVGQSHFRCDLAVRHAQENAYQLGVLVDTDEKYARSDVLERFLLRPGVLRAFHWQVSLVLTKDWYHDREAVLRQLERVMQGSPPEELKGEEKELAEPPEDVPVIQPVEPPPSLPPAVRSADESDESHDEEEESETVGTTPAQPATAFVAPPSGGTSHSPTEVGTTNAVPSSGGRYFEFIGGGSSKFWRATVAGNQFTVHYGRIGTNGQTLTKTFATEADAQREANKLIAEKLRKGYVEKTLPTAL